MASKQDLEKHIKELETLIETQKQLINTLQWEIENLRTQINNYQWQITIPETNPFPVFGIPSTQYDICNDPCPRGGNHVWIEDHITTAIQQKCVKCGQYKYNYISTTTYPATEKYNYLTTEQHNFPATESFSKIQ